MRPATKLTFYGLVLAGALGVGAAAGTAFGPIDTGTERHHVEHDTPTSWGHGGGHDGPGHGAP